MTNIFDNPELLIAKRLDHRARNVIVAAINATDKSELEVGPFFIKITKHGEWTSIAISLDGVKIANCDDDGMGPMFWSEDPAIRQAIGDLGPDDCGCVYCKAAAKVIAKQSVNA